MKDGKENPADNYVKSKDLTNKNHSDRKNHQVMLIKLAISAGKKELDRISSCCRDYSCIYIHIYKNKFGILTDAYELASGQESSNDSTGYNIKKFVDVYNCAKSHPGFIFKKHQNTPYASILLDNQYYINLLTYCKNNGILINYVDFINTQGTIYRKEILDEIERELRSENHQKAVELNLTYNNSDIIIKKNGYIILASGRGTDYYERNRQRIDEIISTGFKDEHD